MQFNQHQMRQLTQGLNSKSDKMRALAKAGYERADIARFLGTRYQFVRNVLIQDEARNARKATEAKGSPNHNDKLAPAKLRLRPHGPLVIPTSFPHPLGLPDATML